MRVICPEHLSRAHVDSPDFREGTYLVDDAILNERVGEQSVECRNVRVPCEAELTDVRVIDLLQWTEMSLVVCATDHCPLAGVRLRARRGVHAAHCNHRREDGSTPNRLSHTVPRVPNPG